jgi:hypothetical protein
MAEDGEAQDPQAGQRGPHGCQGPKVRRFGRKPKLTDHQQAEALKRLAAGRKLPIDCQDNGRAPRHGREADRVGSGPRADEDGDPAGLTARF